MIRKHARLTAIGASLLFSFGFQGAAADTDKEAILANMVEAYGGEKLTDLKALKFHDRFKRFLYGQSHNAREIDLAHYKTNVFIDFENGRKEMQFVGGEGADFYTQHQFFDGEKGYRLNHSSKTLMENENYGLGNVDRRFTLRLDTAIAKLLRDNQAEAIYEGEADLHGNSHHKFVFQPEGYPRLTVYVNAENGLISKATRPHWRPGAEFAYLYSDYRQHDGLTYAAALYEMKAGKPETLSIGRSISTKPDMAGLFVLPDGYGEAPTSLSFREMSVTELAPGVILAGRSWGFSLFVDAGDYLYAVGGYDQLTERLKAVQAHIGAEKPLKYQIVTHHHMDHLGGMKEAYDLGADFITHPDNISMIQEIAGIEIPAERFVPLETSSVFLEGRIKIFDFPNGHAAHNLITYVQDADVVFTADLFVSRQASGAPNGYEGLKAFRETLAEQGIDASRFAAAHSGRVLTKGDLKTASETIVPEVCPADWNLCAEHAGEH